MHIRAYMHPYACMHTNVMHFPHSYMHRDGCVQMYVRTYTHEFVNACAGEERVECIDLVTVINDTDPGHEPTVTRQSNECPRR